MATINNYLFYDRDGNPMSRDEYGERVSFEDVELPELPVPRAREISTIPFELSQLIVKKKEIKKEVIVEKVIAIDTSIETVEILVNGEKKLVKKKKKHVQKKVREASPMDAFKVRMGAPIAASVFYRYVRVPEAKRHDINWKGERKDACLLIYLNSKTQFVFSFALWNGKNPKVFSKDKARKLCQDRLLAGRTVTVTNIDMESSQLENIKRACDNHFFALNKRLNEPSIQSALRISSIQSIQELAKLIKQKFNLEDYN